MKLVNLQCLRASWNFDTHNMHLEGTLLPENGCKMTLLIIYSDLQRGSARYYLEWELLLKEYIRR